MAWTSLCVVHERFGGGQAAQWKIEWGAESTVTNKAGSTGQKVENRTADQVGEDEWSGTQGVCGA